MPTTELNYTESKTSKQLSHTLQNTRPYSSKPYLEKETIKLLSHVDHPLQPIINRPPKRKKRSKSYQPSSDTPHPPATPSSTQLEIPHFLPLNTENTKHNALRPINPTIESPNTHHWLETNLDNKTGQYTQQLKEQLESRKKEPPKKRKQDSPKTHNHTTKQPTSTESTNNPASTKRLILKLTINKKLNENTPSIIGLLTPPPLLMNHNDNEIDDDTDDETIWCAEKENADKNLDQLEFALTKLWSDHDQMQKNRLSNWANDDKNYAILKTMVVAVNTRFSHRPVLARFNHLFDFKSQKPQIKEEPNPVTNPRKKRLKPRHTPPLNLTITSASLKSTENSSKASESLNSTKNSSPASE